MTAAPHLRFVARAFVASALLVGVYGLAKVSVQLANLLLLLYLAVVAGIGLRSLADALRRRTRLSHGLSLALVLLALGGAVVGLGAALAQPLREQVEEARGQLPELHRRVDDWLAGLRDGVQAGPGDESRSAADSPTGQVMEQIQNSPSADFLSWIRGFIGGVSQAVGGPLLALVVAIYLAAAPERYLRGLLALVPPRYRPRAGEVLAELYDTLRAWIVGQVVAMTLVAVVTAIGLTLIGVKMALLLGIVAGLLDFIPNFGPAIAFVPAALVAAEGGRIVPVIVLYVAVQVLEGWIVRPLIEQKAVDTLPAVLVATQVLLATLVGFMGLLAAPALIVLVQVLVQRFYVEDVLGDPARD